MTSSSVSLVTTISASSAVTKIVASAQLLVSTVSGGFVPILVASPPLVLAPPVQASFVGVPAWDEEVVI